MDVRIGSNGSVIVIGSALAVCVCVPVPECRMQLDECVVNINLGQTRKRTCRQNTRGRCARCSFCIGANPREKRTLINCTANFSTAKLLYARQLIPHALYRRTRSIVIGSGLRIRAQRVFKPENSAITRCSVRLHFAWHKIHEIHFESHFACFFLSLSLSLGGCCCIAAAQFVRNAIFRVRCYSREFRSSTVSLGTLVTLFTLICALLCQTGFQW